MSNHPSQEQSAWGGRSSRDDGFGRMNRDPYRDQDYGGAQQRGWQQEGRSGRESSSFSPYGDRDFYERNPASQNYGAYRGGRGESWPRNEDRENYSAAGDYGRSDEYMEDNPQHPANRYHAAGRQQSGARDYGSGQGYSSMQAGGYGNRGFGSQGYEGGQSFGGANAPYSQQLQSPSRWRDYRGQQQAFRGQQGQSGGYQGDWGDSFSQPQYAYGGERNFNQPGYFQAGDFSHQSGYTRSEYPEDSYLHGGYGAHGYSRQNQQAGRTLGTQDWQERAGGQRGAFGLQNSHRGRGPQGYTRSDERIREDICERLSEHHYIDASNIRVEVKDGVVTLEGSVDDRWQKYQTEDLADATSGVRDIQNRLNVSRASQQSPQWTSQPSAQQGTAGAGSTAQAGAAATAAQGGTAATSGRKTSDKSDQERGH